MECEHKNLNQEQFNKKIRSFKRRKDLYFFLMNTFNLILFNGYYYCFCDKEDKKMPNKKNCPLCQIPAIFSNFERDLENNMLDESFLWSYHEKLIFHLQEIFDTDKSALCCFLDDKFYYRGRDWRTEETWSVSLSKQIDYQEKIKKDKARKKVLGPFPSEKRE